MLSATRSQAGFSLVELGTSMTIATILVLTFAAILVMSQRQTDALDARLTLYRDAMVLDQWVERYVQPSIGDSLFIYASATNEALGTQATAGTILHLFQPDSTQIRLAVAGQQLDWQVNSTSHYPLDCQTEQVQFVRHSGHLTALNIQLTLLNGEDSLVYNRYIVPRN